MNNFNTLSAESEMSTLAKMTSAECDEMNAWIDTRTERDELLGDVSDAHKELYGMRPRNIDRLSTAQLRDMLYVLRDDIQREIAIEQAEEREHQSRYTEAMSPKRWAVGDVTRW